MEHPTTWLLVANGNSAFIYDFTHKANLDSLRDHLIKSFNDPEARLKSSEIMSDEVGRYKSMGGKASIYAPDTDPHQAEIQHFAHLLNDFLLVEHSQNHYKELVVCAEARFSGILEGIFAKPVKASVKTHIHKDYIPLLEKSYDSFVEHFKRNL